MSNPTLDDLLVPRSRDDLEAILLSALQGHGFPVSDWFSGGVARTMLKMVANGLADRETLIRYIVSGGFIDFAATLVDPNGVPVEDWMEALAAQLYAISRGAATATQKAITLTCSSGPGPYTKAAGELVAVSQAGNRYRSSASTTIPDGGSVTATFICDTPGLVVDATGTIDQLVTPLPGVTILDVQTHFSVPVSTLSGTGTIIAAAGEMPSPPRTLKVEILGTGRRGEGSCKITRYAAGVVTVTGPQVIPTTYYDGDVSLGFYDGGAGTNSFVAGDTWTVSTPGESTVATGAAKESISSLAERCRGRWPSLSAIPTENRYAMWARQCSIDNALGFDRISVQPSEEIAGYVNVYLADASGAAPSAAVETVQDYLDLRASVIERAVASGASALTINVTGTVWVKRNLIATVKASAKTQWAAYLATVPIGGVAPDRRIPAAELVQILMDLGAINSETIYVNGAQHVTLAINQVPTSSASGTNALTWIEVP